MIASFIEGFVLGLGAAVPLGPVNILIMTNALKNYKNAVALGAGAMSADMTYLSLLLFGFLAFAKNSTFQVTVGFFGVFFLAYISYLIFKGRNQKIQIHQKGQIVEKDKIFSNYLKGYSITLLNPYTIGFWISVSAYIANKNLSFLFTILGLFCAILLWITLMPLAIHKTKHLFSQRITKNISILSSVIILFFAVGMAVKIVSNIF